MGVSRASSARWNLATHSDDGNMCSLVNLGTRPALEVTVQLLKGHLRRPRGRVTFGRIDPGCVVAVYRLSELPRWDQVTVTWRDAGWLPRRRLRWDSDRQSAPSASDQR